jgi:hypothetical protein
MQKDTYIRQVLDDHLLTDDCLQLTKEEAKHKIDNLKLTLISLINNSQNFLSQAENFLSKKLQAAPQVTDLLRFTKSA